MIGYSEDHMTYGQVIAFERLVNRVNTHPSFPMDRA